MFGYTVGITKQPQGAQMTETERQAAVRRVVARGRKAAANGEIGLDEYQPEDFQTAYAKHVAHFMAQIPGPEPWGPEPFGPGYVTDLCRCGHERGSHWDGEGSCDPAECGCRIFREQQA
jgi:hypothetical protein